MKDLQSLSRRAILYTLPIYEMARMRSASALRKTSDGEYADGQGNPASLHRWINLFSHSRRLLNASDRRVVTPNNDTLYTNAWLDLSDGPLLIKTPETGSRYYVTINRRSLHRVYRQVKTGSSRRLLLDSRIPIEDLQASRPACLVIVIQPRARELPQRFARFLLK